MANFYVSITENSEKNLSLLLNYFWRSLLDTLQTTYASPAYSIWWERIRMGYSFVLSVLTFFRYRRSRSTWPLGGWWLRPGCSCLCFWENISMDCCFRRKPRARLWTVSRMNLCKMPMKILPVKTWGVWVSCEQRKRHHTESLKYQARKMTKKQMKHPPEQCQGGLRDTIFKRESTCKGNREIRLQKDWLPK